MTHEIHNSREARKEKALKPEGGDMACPVCGEVNPEEATGSLGIGFYHDEHLTDDELEYAQEREDSEEDKFDRAEFREVAESYEF